MSICSNLCCLRRNQRQSLKLRIRLEANSSVEVLLGGMQKTQNFTDILYGFMEVYVRLT